MINFEIRTIRLVHLGSDILRKCKANGKPNCFSGSESSGVGLEAMTVFRVYGNVLGIILMNTLPTNLVSTTTLV